MSSGKLILGALAGLAAGAVLGILFAPDKGSKTRKKLLKKEDNSLGEFKDKFNQLIEELAVKVDAGKEDASSFLADGKAKANELKKEIKNAVN